MAVPVERQLETLHTVRIFPGKRRPGRFTWKEDRELIAMAAGGATVTEAAT
jgi:hypothetical protein